MTPHEKNELRAATGMRRLLELDAQPEEVVRTDGPEGAFDEKGVLVRPDGTRLAYRIRRGRLELAGVRPVLVLGEGLSADELEARMLSVLREGRTVMTVPALRTDDGRVETLARRAEDALSLARQLSHRSFGKTVEVRAVGPAVPPAALMMALERFYFSELRAERVPVPHPNWPAWQEMAK